MREEVWALWSGETARRLRPESGATGWLRAAVQTMPQCFQSCVPGPQRRASWSKTLYEVRRDQGHRRIWPEGADRHGLALVVQGMRQTRQRRTCRTESHGPTGRYTAADGGGQVMYWLWREQAAERLLQTQRSERWAQPTLQVMRDCLQPCVRRAERGASRGMATNCRPTTAEASVSRNGNPHKLALDHDHVTMQFRGVLCRACNTALGCANDDPALLRKLADYLESGGIA